MAFPDPPERVDAGSFGQWLAAMRAVLRGERDADVPCGDCVGCCVSAYPIPLRPGDVRARAEVPEQFLLGTMAAGERWMMGFREDGSCPFMEAGRCGIYTDRPQTCRDYDCRIYAAAGLVPDGNRAIIERRVKQWEFSFASAEEREAAAAVRRAARFIQENAALFPSSLRAGSATAAAVMAIKCFPAVGAAEVAGSEAEVTQRILATLRKFDQPEASGPA